jgi:two-component system sensor histidine kinase RegB
MPLSHLLEEVIAPHQPFGVAIKVDLPPSRAGEPVVARNPAIMYGLGNLVENAVDFANDRVTVSADWNADQVSLVVTDDGPGFAPDVINRIGEPYVTMRGRRRPGEETPGGLGLGFFIAKTLLERTGAVLSFENRTLPETGAIIRVRWPRSSLEVNPGPEGVSATSTDRDTKSAATLVMGGAEN